MAPTQQQEPFLKLSNALDSLFQRYEGLKQSLANHLEKVFKIRDATTARNQALKINIIVRGTRDNLFFYLNTALKEMCTAMEQLNFDDCKEKASLAQDTMNDLASQTQTDDKAMANLTAVLRQQEQNKKEFGVPDIDEVTRKSQKQEEPFIQLSNALDSLFQRYEGLKQSLANLSKKVVKIWDTRTARDQALKIDTIVRGTRDNLFFYLNTALKEMCTAMEQLNFDDCKEKAGLAQYTMNKLLSQTQADDEAMANLTAVLRQQEQNKKEIGAPDIDEATKEVRILTSVAFGLLEFIKDELHKAFDDSKLFINSDALLEEVVKVRQTIAEAKNACDEIFLALDNIISTMDRLSDEENTDKTVIKSLKSNAKILRNNCEKKLPSVRATRS
ncbi:hypothetical protein OS493_013206 [Desmophyllum pertusum]|uniref:Uncharacterized protein n=1 Tax=Desmophyllum pertusum TaxID=174260 RepID=A0A9W9YQ41_9CNID|nr:hypothetical protein OS493_013206 [Desmophyllum pertusum]